MKALCGARAVIGLLLPSLLPQVLMLRGGLLAWL